MAGRQVCEEKEHGQGVVKVAQGIDEGGVALLDDVIELDLGDEVPLEACGISSFAAAQGAGNLLCDGLVFAKLGQEWLVEQVVDVFGVVEGGGSGRALGDDLLLARFAGVDALEDAQAAEVGERNLQLLHRAGARDVVFGGASVAFIMC